MRHIKIRLSFQPDLSPVLCKDHRVLKPCTRIQFYQGPVSQNIVHTFPCRDYNGIHGCGQTVFNTVVDEIVSYHAEDCQNRGIADTVQDKTAEFPSLFCRLCLTAIKELYRSLHQKRLVDIPGIDICFLVILIFVQPVVYCTFLFFRSGIVE